MAGIAGSEAEVGDADGGMTAALRTGDSDRVMEILVTHHGEQIAACADPDDPHGAPSPCQDLAARQLYLAAAPVCEQAYVTGGNPADAIAAALAYVKLRLDDRALTVASHVLNSPRGAEARRLIARIQLGRKQFDAARSLLEDALRLDQDHHEHASAYADAKELVSASWDRNDFATALRFANIACAEAAASGDRGSHGTSLIALGAVFHAAGDAARAIDAYAQATSELPPDDLAGRARVLLSRAELLDEQRQYALARPLLEEARMLAVRLHDASLIVAAEVNLADIALGKHDRDAAAAHLDGAEAAWRTLGDRTPSQGILINRSILARYRHDFAGALRVLDVLAASDPPADTAWTIAYERGQIAAAQHDASAAAAHYLAAIGIIEEMWRTASPEELKAPFFEDRWRPYQALFALRVAQNAPDAAFATVVSAQGRMFLAETIAASTDAEGSIERRDRLRSLAPVVAASPQARSLGPAETLAALNHRYVLNYFAGGDRMHLLVLDRGKVRLASVNIELAELDRLIDAFLAQPDDRAAAAALGRALLPPDALASAPTRFYIIPDGPLLRVPFAALLVGPERRPERRPERLPERLIEHHEIIYAPSATGLAGLSIAAPGSPGPAVLLSDARNDLDHASEETRSVVAATRATPRTGEQATTAALRSAQDASLLHIIGHSGIGIDGGYLTLADGRVGAAEILSWHLRPGLVVLSTCASAASNRRDMWGSLAAAFLAAGSRDVVATLFSVEDRVAAEFTERFYHHRGARDPVAAAAAAQRELATRYPTSAWASFLVVGL